MRTNDAAYHACYSCCFPNQDEQDLQSQTMAEKWMQRGARSTMGKTLTVCILAWPHHTSEQSHTESHSLKVHRSLFHVIVSLNIPLQFLFISLSFSLVRYEFHYAKNLLGVYLEIIRYASNMPGSLAPLNSMHNQGSKSQNRRKNRSVAKNGNRKNRPKFEN